ncbi:MAG: methyltransferase, partial [Firmicutes bacterium]|nr:methyltransferase [Bacillota bacterium]
MWAWQPALAEAVRRLKAAGIEDAAREGMLLLRAAYAGEGEAPVPFERLYAAPFPPAVAERFHRLAVRRARREPMAYLLGRREFYGLDLAVGPGVLVPRPETESLVEAALAVLPARRLTIVDVGTGSGAVALALAARGPAAWAVTAADVSPRALAVAR